MYSHSSKGDPPVKIGLVLMLRVGITTATENRGPVGIVGLGGPEVIETGSHVTGTGSDVIWKGKPLTGWKKSRAQTTGSHVVWGGKLLTGGQKDRGLRGTGSHVVLKGKPLTGWKKGSRAQGTGSHVVWKGKPRREHGLRVQSSNQAPGGGGIRQRRRHVGKK